MEKETLEIIIEVLATSVENLARRNNIQDNDNHKQAVEIVKLKEENKLHKDMDNEVMERLVDSVKDKDAEIARLKEDLLLKGGDVATFKKTAEILAEKYSKEKAKGLGCQRLVKLIKKKASIGQKSSEGARLILAEHRDNEKKLRAKKVSK